MNMFQIIRKKPDPAQYIDCYETVKVFVKYHKPVFLCDIGASNGSWSYTLSLLDPELRHVVSFEPRRDAFNELRKRNIPGVKNVCFPYGLSTKRSKILLRGGTTSASFLPEKEQQNIFPNSLNGQTEIAQVYRLDYLYAKFKLPLPDTIKLDVQGYEQHVLEGGLHILSHAQYLVIELSFREFYKGQPPLSRIIKFLERNKFELVDFGYEWRVASGELVQIDGIFRNTHRLT